MGHRPRVARRRFVPGVSATHRLQSSVPPSWHGDAGTAVPRSPQVQLPLEGAEAATLSGMDHRTCIAALGGVRGGVRHPRGGAHLGPVMISKVDVARGASDQLGVQLQEVPPVIDCSNEPALPRQVGAGQDCSETDLTRGQRHAAHVRIDRVEGVRNTYSVVVGTASLPPPAD